MKQKIEKLTTAQAVRLAEFREEWRQIGLCCDPADFAEGDAVIKGFYGRIGKPEPLILHFSSPMMCELAVAFVGAALNEEPKGLWGEIRGKLIDEFGGEIRDQLGVQLRGEIRDQLGVQLKDQLGVQLKDQLGGEIRDQLGGELRGQIKRSQFLYNSFAGQHECYWQAFYLFGQEIGVRYEAETIELLLEWARLSKSVGWWAPFEGICFVSDRPREVHFDQERRLHSESGMAVRYSDGWGTHAWHGQRIPAEWIETPEKLTAEAALTWPQIEQRRAACEILGWDAILTELNAATVDRDSDPEIGELVEVDIPEIGRERFLRVRCGTGRQFALPVPPDMRTALQANAWTYGFDAATFLKPEIRT